MRGLFGHRDFRLLLAGQSASTIGDRIVFVVLALYVTEIGTPSEVGIVLAAHAVPLVGFLLIGGVWADRLPPHLVVVTTDLIGFALHPLAGGADLHRRGRGAGGRQRDRPRRAGGLTDLARGLEPAFYGRRSVPVTSTTTSPPTRTRPSSSCASSRLGRPISTPWVTSTRSSPVRAFR